MAHFYLDETLGFITTGDAVALTGAEARHAVSVSRLRVGESVLLGNGNGLIAFVEAVAVDKDRVDFVVGEVRIEPRPKTRVTLVQALTKGDRDERAIEAATELGVDDVIPWGANRSVSVWTGAKTDRGVERWRTIVREAAKQSIRPFVPRVNGHRTTEQLCREFSDELILVLDPTGDTSSHDEWSTLVTQAVHLGRNVWIVVGPEGGISPHELEEFAARGAIFVRLGSNILRSSTAGPAFLAAINSALGRW